MRHEIKGLDGPVTVAEPPSVETIARQIVADCRCYACKANRELLERMKKETKP